MKTCPICTAQFEPRRMGQKACSPICDRERKRQRKIRNERILAIKSRQDWLKDFQRVFNAYIRARDSDHRCISCGGNLGESFDAGHYRSVGSSQALRFHPYNVHGQCRKCNRFLAGNLISYRQGLRERHGNDLVEFLDSDRTLYRWTIEDCKEGIEYFTALTKELKRGT